MFRIQPPSACNLVKYSGTFTLCAAMFAAIGITAINAARAQPRPGIASQGALLTEEQGINARALGNVFQILLSPRYADQFDLTEEQRAELRKLDGERNRILTSQIATGILGGEKPQGSSPEQLRGEMSAISEKALSVLLPHQLNRLRQLNNQLRARAGGIGAGVTTSMARDALAISAAQAEQIDSIVTKGEADLAAKIESLKEEIRRIQSDMRSSVIKRLSEAQRMKYTELFGEVLEDDVLPARIGPRGIQRGSSIKE